MWLIVFHGYLQYCAVLQFLLQSLLITFGLGKKFSAMKLAYVPNLKEMRKTYFQAEKKMFSIFLTVVLLFILT